jgi:cytochrome P450
MDQKMTAEKTTAVSHAGTALDPSQGPAASAMPWLRSYQDVVDVFRSKDFIQGGGGRRDSKPIIGDGVLSLAGTDHFERRRIESVLFRRPSLRFFEGEVLAPSLAAELARAVAGRGPDGVVRTELSQLLRATFRRVSATFWGIDDVDSPARAERFLHYLDMIGPAGDVEWESKDHREVVGIGLHYLALFDQEFFTPSRLRREALIAAHREGRLPAESLPHDLITVMLRHREHFAKWDDGVFLRELILFAPGASVIRVVPHIVNELAEWVEQHPTDEALLQDVTFLRRASNESLRLHPVSPFFIRKAERDTVLGSGRAFSAGSYVVLDIIAASRDPEVFGEDANEFNPHRVAAIPIKPTGLAFGDGPHTCIGMAMSIGEASSDDEESDGSVGFIVHVLRELYRAGVRCDPDHPPRWNDANVRNEYAEYPVRLERL